jgi:hypothetical protein
VEIFANQGAPPYQGHREATFAIGTSGVVDTGGKFATGYIYESLLNL